MPNRLANETSPYLLQHANNPVDWYPWGDEALRRAADEDKPIFLSIGYSACHWCHVMEHESFEAPNIAALLNEHFISIKVDREERPDLDQIYMNAVQLMTGRGGWPMSVFLTPEQQPFYGGTYWPPESRMGMPGFTEVLNAVRDAWQNRREQANAQADELTRHLQNVGNEGAPGEITSDLIHASVAQLERVVDLEHGGFGQAPKFPHSMDLQLLLRDWYRTRRDGVLDIVRLTLDRMADGGIYDHLAGGFARYSVDERWLVPHFEKMLYDNALLTTAYLEGFLVTGEARYAQVCRETLDYVLNYMTDDAGGFHSTEDADSEGIEGKFYVWTPDEIKAVLGEERSERFCYVYDVSEGGNFEGKSILNLPKSVEQCAALRGWDRSDLETQLREDRAKLLEVRDRRVRPAKDDKVLVSWNALMIEAMARAAGVLDEPRYLDAAVRAAEFIMSEMRDSNGRLLHTWRHGRAKLPAYLDDYAYLANATATLYEASFDERWFDESLKLAETMLRHFADPDDGGFYFTADDHERLIARHKDMHDSSVPSGNSVAATALLRIGKLSGRTDLLATAERTLQLAIPLIDRAPTAAGQMLLAVDMAVGPTPEIVILGDANAEPTQTALRGLRSRFVPNYVLACRASAATGSEHLHGLFAGKVADGSEPNVFVCENFSCQAPVSGADQVRALWDRLESGDG